MVVVNLYAFEKTAAKPGVHFDEIIENIDIGGPSMVRSAAKNFEDVAIVTSPSDYAAIADELTTHGGALSRETKWRLAQKAFATTAAYDSAIATTLEQISPRTSSCAPASRLSRRRCASASRTLDLRYGENPHQKAALYADGSGAGIANGTQLQGKELCYNNLVDLQAAGTWRRSSTSPRCAIIKHTNPCGTATGKLWPSLQARARMRSGFRLRRRHRHESPLDGETAERDGQAFRRSDRRARLRRSGARGICREEEPAARRSRSGCAAEVG